MKQANALPADEFLNMAAISNLFEIQASEIARNKTHNNEVRKFAERMLHDHTSIAERLQAAAHDKQAPSSLDRQHEQMLEALRSAPDTSIDLAYVDAQLQAHREAVEIFDRYCQNGDDDALKRIAEETLPELRDHLQAVQQIQGDLELAARNGGQTSSPNQERAPVQTQSRSDQQSRIVVEQPAPSVHVGQSSPQVAVQQAQPNVTVRQPQPEIHVRQPQPTITVEIPQPEITVRMPRPEVNVEMAQPQVEVNQPKPQVQVRQSHQANVEVESAKPQVRMEGQAGFTPQVDVQQTEGQPRIQYEQAEARVIVKQGEGQPKIRYERAGEASTGSTEAAAPAHSTSAPPSAYEAGEAPPSRYAAGQTPPAAETQTGGASGGQAIMASQLIDLLLYDTGGDRLGEVERVVSDENGRICIVVGSGGFLGIGKRVFAIPAEAVMMDRGYLVTNTMTEEEIDALSQTETSERAYSDLPGTQQIRISQGR